jgi:hypothetical protein
VVALFLAEVHGPSIVYSTRMVPLHSRMYTLLDEDEDEEDEEDEAEDDVDTPTKPNLEQAPLAAERHTLRTTDNVPVVSFARGTQPQCRGKRLTMSSDHASTLSSVRVADAPIVSRAAAATTADPDSARGEQMALLWVPVPSSGAGIDHSQTSPREQEPGERDCAPDDQEALLGVPGSRSLKVKQRPPDESGGTNEQKKVRTRTRHRRSRSISVVLNRASAEKVDPLSQPPKSSRTCRMCSSVPDGHGFFSLDPGTAILPVTH